MADCTMCVARLAKIYWFLAKNHFVYVLKILQSISFEHPTSALSFATCVDGYCRLSVEFYNQICSSPEVIGERALMLRKARCYGPIK